MEQIEDLKKFKNFKEKNLKFSKNFNNFYKKKNLQTLRLFKWLSFSKNKRYVRYRFLIFIFGIIDKDSGKNFYLEQLKEIYFNRKASFYISFEHLVLSDPIMSVWVADEPEIMFKIFKDTCEEIIKDIFNKSDEKLNIPIRLQGLPLCETMRNLKKKKPNCLVKIRGFVISKTQIFPTIGFFRLTCLKCLETQDGLFSTVDSETKRTKNCFNCKSSGPFQIKWDKLISNQFQKISIREELKINSYRWLPYSVEVILTGDLIDYVDYGDIVEITGILKYSITPKSKTSGKTPSFFTLVEGNSVHKVKNLKNLSKISFSEVKILEKIFKEQRLLPCLLYSFIPDIFKNYHLKLSILLVFCSFRKKNLESNMNIRNSINMLILGNPCTGKSKILKSIFNFFPQSHFFTGYGSSVKGLTVYLKHDKIISGWIPEGGVLTFAKESLCLIDGLEGFSSNDIISLLKILDHQYISLDTNSKLKNLSVCNSTIATLNNFNMIENPSLPLFLNYGLDESLVTKFDIIFKIEKIQNKQEDKNLLKFIINKFQKFPLFKQKIEKIYSNLKFKEDKFKIEYLSKSFILRYLEYCKNNFTPKFGIVEQSFILKFYIGLKKETHRLNSISFSSNFLETIIRLISSSAKIHLRAQVFEKDLAIGFLIFFESWVQLQPYFTGNYLRSKFKKFFEKIFKKYEDCFIFLNRNLFNFDKSKI